MMNRQSIMDARMERVAVALRMPLREACVDDKPLHQYIIEDGYFPARRAWNFTFAKSLDLDELMQDYLQRHAPELAGKWHHFRFQDTADVWRAYLQLGRAVSITVRPGDKYGDIAHANRRMKNRAVILYKEASASGLSAFDITRTAKSVQEIADRLSLSDRLWMSKYDAYGYFDESRRRVGLALEEFRKVYSEAYWRARNL